MQPFPEKVAYYLIGCRLYQSLAYFESRQGRGSSRTFVVVGTDRDPKTGALRALLAHNDDVGLNYAGAAFIALAGDERAQFFTVVDRLTTSWAMFKSSRLTDVRWCHPKLTVWW